jgi:hypothetical protein
MKAVFVSVHAVIIFHNSKGNGYMPSCMLPMSQDSRTLWLTKQKLAAEQCCEVYIHRNRQTRKMPQEFGDILSLKPTNAVMCNVIKLMVPKTLLGKGNFLLLFVLITLVFYRSKTVRQGVRLSTVRVVAIGGILYVKISSAPHLFTFSHIQRKLLCYQ